MKTLLSTTLALALLLHPFAHADTPMNTPAVQPALPVSGIDHIGINVPDLDAAIAFFGDLVGARVISDIRPGHLPDDWKKRFNWHSSSELQRFVMLQLPGATKIELFQYTGTEANRSLPHGDDAGATHIALRSDDIEQSLAVIRAHGLPLLNEPITNADGVRWFYFLTPWGAQMELVSAPRS